MTLAELTAERDYRYAERIAILTENAPTLPPAPEQVAIARKEADDWFNEHYDPVPE